MSQNDMQKKFSEVLPTVGIELKDNRSVEVKYREFIKAHQNLSVYQKAVLIRAVNRIFLNMDELIKTEIEDMQGDICEFRIFESLVNQIESGTENNDWED